MRPRERATEHFEFRAPECYNHPLKRDEADNFLFCGARGAGLEMETAAA